jgi:hypothetical protein
MQVSKFSYGQYFSVKKQSSQTRQDLSIGIKQGSTITANYPSYFAHNVYFAARCINVPGVLQIEKLLRSGKIETREKGLDLICKRNQMIEKHPELRSHKCVKMVIKALNDLDIRYYAIKALGRNKEAIKPIANILNHTYINSLEKIYAIDALINIGGQNVIAPLVNEFFKPERSCRSVIGNALIQMKTKKGTNPLIDILLNKRIHGMKRIQVMNFLKETRQELGKNTESFIKNYNKISGNEVEKALNLLLTSEDGWLKFPSEDLLKEIKRFKQNAEFLNDMKKSQTKAQMIQALKKYNERGADIYSLVKDTIKDDGDSRSLQSMQNEILKKEIFDCWKWDIKNPEMSKEFF